MSLLGTCVRQGEVVVGAGFVRVEREVELVLPADCAASPWKESSPQGPEQSYIRTGSFGSVIPSGNRESESVTSRIPT